MWEKGKSGNPAGAAKRRLITSHLERELLEAVDDTTKARKIAQKIVDEAVAGDHWAIQFVTERTEGRPDQHVSISREVREVSDGELVDIATGSGNGASGEKESTPVPSKLH